MENKALAPTGQLALDVAAAGLVNDQIRLNAAGRIIDFLNQSETRPNTPEERVRQNFARKLHFEYGYPCNLLVFEARINIGSETRRADIAIYRDPHAASQQDQGGVRIVVETKAPTIKRGEAQLQSYIFASSAQGGVWINDSDAPKYFRRVDVPQQRLDEWPNIPRYGEEWDGVGRHVKSQLRPPHNLVETFQRCHNALYKVGIDSEDLAMDMVRMILAKYRDEANPGESCEFRCTPLELQSDKGRKQVAKRVHALFEQVRDEHPSIFDKHESISAGDREIATVVSELQDFRFVPDDDSDDIYDIVGAAYEVYVGAHLKGPRGQYFTPRLIVQLMTRIVDPKERDLILDPAMGSGGFLIAAMRHVTRAVNRSKRNAPAKRVAIRNVRQHLYGIDKSPKLVKVARTNMILANDGHAGLVRGDSLGPLSDLGADFILRMHNGAPHVILTNPPFGATSEHRITAEKEPEILARYQLGHVWRRDEKTSRLRPTTELLNDGAPPEYLFIERCVEWLAPGGRLGIVVPRGVLDNDKALSVRAYLLRETRLLAVINCHDDTFKPHTDAKTAILVCEKKKHSSEVDDDYPIFMAISQSIGHTGLGHPIFRSDSKGDPKIVNGQLELDQDLDDIYASWVALREGRPSLSEYYFNHTRAGLTDALNLNPVGYLPKYEASRQAVLRLGEQPGWRVERLGVVAEERVFMGTRVARPPAARGVTSGHEIVRYFTGNAVTQTRGENIKYLDLNKAKPQQRKALEQMRLRRGMILITRSGTVGRVVYATSYHNGAIGTDDLIRVVITDPILRGYVYQFLLSELGQNQLKANIYGAIVDHIEPKDVKQILVPIPSDRGTLKAIGRPVIEGIRLQERANRQMEHSMDRLLGALGARGGNGDEEEEDEEDIEIARRRLDEIERDPANLISGDALTRALNDLDS